MEEGRWLARFALEALDREVSFASRLFAYGAAPHTELFLIVLGNESQWCSQVRPRKQLVGQRRVQRLQNVSTGTP